MTDIFYFLDHHSGHILIGLAIIFFLMIVYSVGYVHGIRKSERQFMDKFVSEEKQ